MCSLEYRIQKKEEQLRSQVCRLPSSTHTYTNAIPLDYWSISRDSTNALVSLCDHRNAPAIPLGSLCIHSDAPSHKSPVKMPPSTFLPHPRFSDCILNMLQGTVRLRVCAHQVRGLILRNFWCLVAYLCRVVSLRQ